MPSSGWCLGVKKKLKVINDTNISNRSTRYVHLRLSFLTRETQ